MLPYVILGQFGTSGLNYKVNENFKVSLDEKRKVI